MDVILQRQLTASWLSQSVHLLLQFAEQINPSGNIYSYSTFIRAVHSAYTNIDKAVSLRRMKVSSLSPGAAPLRLSAKPTVSNINI
jgi:hypothetical protein